MQTNFYLLGALLLLVSCTQAPPTSASSKITGPYEHIADPGVKRVLQSAIEKAGGLAKWNKLETIRFTKDYALLFESGEVENAAFQTHTYTFGADPRVNINWEKEGSKHAIRYREGRYEKLLGGQVDTSAAQQSLINNVLSATFVISIPFKLLDEGVELSYGGLDTLANGQVVEVIRAAYNPTDHTAHSTPDIWHHYYDAEDFTFLAYMVQHADHYSYVENRSYTEVDGFLLPKIRKSYRVDEDQNLLYLRADYAYDDYELTFVSE